MIHTHTNRRRFISILVTLAMVATMFATMPLTANAAGEELGSGSVNDPYVTFEFFENDEATPQNATLTPVWTSTGLALEYSLDGVNWINAESGTPITSVNNKILMRGSGRASLYNSNAHNSNKWVTSATKMKVSGDLNTLLDYQNPPKALSDYCFAGMFFGCQALVSAPVLSATTLANYCYYKLFEGCVSLKYVAVNFTSWTGSNITNSWLSGVAPQGTFYKPEGLTPAWGTSEIPTAWEFGVVSVSPPSLSLSPLDTIDLITGYANNNFVTASAPIPNDIPIGIGKRIYSVSSDANSSGVTINASTGNINIPAGLSAGIYTVGIKASNIYGSDEKNLTIHVYSTPLLEEIPNVDLPVDYKIKTFTVPVSGDGKKTYSVGASNTGETVIKAVDAQEKKENGTVADFVKITIPVNPRLTVGHYAVDIVVTTQYGTDTKTLNIDVHAPPKLNSFANKVLYVGFKRDTSIVASVTGDGARTYSIDDPEKTKATIDSNGRITIPAGLGQGNYSVEVTVETDYGKDVKRLDIQVLKPSIRTSITKIFLTKGQKTKVPIVIDGQRGKVSYKSSNKKIVTVDKNGQIIAKKSGKAVITIKNNGVTQKITVNVTSKSTALAKVFVTGLAKTYKVGKTADAKLTLNPVKATYKAVTFKSGNPKIATVDKAGHVIFKAKGKVKLTIKVGNKKIVKTIKVS